MEKTQHQIIDEYVLFGREMPKSDNYCSEIDTSIIDSKLFKKIINSHYSKRFELFNQLNKIGKSISNFDYPNLDFINNFGQLLKINDKCLCQILTNPENTPFENIKEFGKGKTGVATLVKIRNTPPEHNFHIVKGIKNIKLYEYLSLYVKPIVNVTSRADELNNDYVNSNKCIFYNLTNFKDNNHPNSVNFYGILSTGGDNYSNQTAIHMILNAIMDDNPNYIYQYDAFVCSDKSGIIGYSLTEFANQGDISTFIENPSTIISDNFLIDMIRQLLYPLSILKSDEYGFCHSDFKCRNVFVSLEPNEDKTNLIPVYKIADVDKSSIFWNGIRFYNNFYNNNPLLSGIQLAVSYFSDYQGFPIKLQDGVAYYELQGKLTNAYTMHSSVPMLMSYDIYMFIYSMLRESKIWEFIRLPENVNCQFINNIKLLFIEDDFNKISTDCENRYKELNTLISNHEQNINNLKTFINPTLQLYTDIIKYSSSLTDEEYEVKVQNWKKDPNITKYDVFSSSYFGKTTKTNPVKDLIRKIKISNNEIVNYVVESRSLNHMISDLTRMKIKLRVNIDSFYTSFGINPPKTNIDPPPIKSYKLAENYTYTIGTSNYHICLDECMNDGKYNVCNTNKYSSRSSIYTKGLCKPNL